MKLLRAEFENFRLLRDLKLEFSTETASPEISSTMPE